MGAELDGIFDEKYYLNLEGGILKRLAGCLKPTEALRLL